MRRYPLCALLLGLAVQPLAAQGDPQCNSATTTPAQNACNTAVDAMKAFGPLAGLVISGGNPVLGTAGTLGGFGHIAFSARGNATKVGSVALGTGYGARIGIIKGSLLVPSVSVSWMHRHLPRLQYGDVNTNGQMDFAMELDA